MARTEKVGNERPSSTGWRWVSFGEVVRNVNLTEPDPLSAGVERYVGLEHLDSESLQIKRWGFVEEGTTFTRKFVKGQVLFGKRRAYQRKAAVAEFDGVCSGDLLVLETKEELLPELLPFIVTTEDFFQHALGTSAGSLSPRTKWGELAKYEFALPPKSEQRRIASLLSAADDAALAYEMASEEGDAALLALARSLLASGKPSDEDEDSGGSWIWEPLGNAAVVSRGKFAHRPRNLPRFYGGPYPFVQTGDVAAARGLLREYQQTLSEEGREISKSFPPGSILITIAAVIGETAITTFETWCPDSVVGIIPGHKLDARFLEFFLRTIKFDLAHRTATQTAQKNINLKHLRRLLVPVPPLDQQREIVGLLADFQKGVESMYQHSRAASLVRKSLSERLIGDHSRYSSGGRLVQRG